ncbi:DUF4255 domain-containing protein [Halioxenophilus sp. WMMB6]|uniref:DUF4255 domain-containing protein n=1 Tax=Halioxenophilus sp. WMMB6 TaxID=3073815 RepID=UPI00295F520B|nr:DUF4255 domain-containing protein [Halioxenophilus sp. WMMB6]
MLDHAINFFASELNTYFQAKTGIIGEAVFPSVVVRDDGKFAIKDDTIGVTVINIEEESVFKDQVPEVKFRDGQNLKMEPKLRLNLCILFAANYKLYEQSLKHLSLILTYFQSNRTFTPSQFPALAPTVERLSVELQTLNYDQLNQIWSYIGGKHLPSIIYRVRAVAIQDNAITETQPPLTIINSQNRGV